MNYALMHSIANQYGYSLLILNTHSVFSVLTGHFCVVTFRVYWNQLREDLYSLGMNIAVFYRWDVLSVAEP